MTDKRRRAFVLGLDAEWFAGILLAIKGYRVLETRYRAPGGEVDIIAQRGGTLVFVEVKARPDLDAAALAITPAKLARLGRAAAHYLGRAGRNHGPSITTIRCDAVLVAPGRLPRHIRSVAELPLG